MKLFNAFKSNPADLKPATLQKELKTILTPHEKVEKAYLLPQTVCIFTDKRLIIGDTVGFAENSAPCHSIPYRSVTHFSITPFEDQSPGMQLFIWLHGDAVPLELTLDDSPGASELHSTLGDYVLNKHSPWLNKQLMWKKQSGLKSLPALGLTGAAMLAVICIHHKHRKEKPSLSEKLIPAALTAIVLKKLKA